MEVVVVPELSWKSISRQVVDTHLARTTRGRPPRRGREPQGMGSPGEWRPGRVVDPAISPLRPRLPSWPTDSAALVAAIAPRPRPSDHSGTGSRRGRCTAAAGGSTGRPRHRMHGEYDRGYRAETAVTGRDTPQVRVLRRDRPWRGRIRPLGGLTDPRAPGRPPGVWRTPRGRRGAHDGGQGPEPPPARTGAGRTPVGGTSYSTPRRLSPTWTDNRWSPSSS